MPKKKRKGKGRIERRNEHENQCDICGAPDTDKTRYTLTAQLARFEDHEQFLAFAHGETDDAPDLLGPYLLSRCPHHTDEEILRAGFVPAGMVSGKFQGLREGFAAMPKPGDGPPVPDWHFETYQKVRHTFCVNAITERGREILTGMLEARSERPEAREALEALRADGLFREADPDIQAHDARLKRGARAWEQNARANGHEDQITEVDRECADLTARLTAQQAELQRTMDEVNRDGGQS